MTNGLLNIENKLQMDYCIVYFFLKPSHLTPDDVDIFTILYMIFANKLALPPIPH
jgi:hypothetical protein